MTAIGDPVLDASIGAAVAVSQAARGWILIASDTTPTLEVVATAGAATALGTEVPSDGSAAGYVASLGQPLAAVLRSADQFPHDVAGLGGGTRPTSVLCVPCEHGDVVTGVLQLVDAAGGTFSFDDVELAMVIAGIVGAALAHRPGEEAVSVPDPMDLGRSLVRLAEADPAGYRLLAPLLGSLLADG